MEIPLISIAYIILGLICFFKRRWLIKFAIIALPLITVALINVYVEPVFSINLSQYGIMLLFLYLMMQKVLKDQSYESPPRVIITLMLIFIFFIPISWIAINNPNLYTLIYVPPCNYARLPINFSAQHISKILYAIFGFFVFIVSFKVLSLCNSRVIAKTFVFSGFLMAFFGLFDFFFPTQMEGLRRILLPPNVSMEGVPRGPVISLGGVQRVYGLMCEPGGLAEYLLGVIFFMLANSISDNVIWGRLKDRFLISLLAISTMFTGSSSIVVAILLFPFMLLLIPFLTFKRKALTMWAKGIGIALILVIIVLGLSLVFPSNMRYFYDWTLYKLRLIGRFAGGSREVGSLILLKILLQSPWIGLGLGSIGTESSTFGAGLVMLLLNVGIIGSLLYLSVMIFTVKRALKMLRYESGEVYSFRKGFLWAFILIAIIELVARGLAILHAPHLWFLAGACIANYKNSHKKIKRL